jgi:hypothetical protein
MSFAQLISMRPGADPLCHCAARLRRGQVASLTKGDRGDLSCNDTNLLLNIRINLHFAEQEK